MGISGPHLRGPHLQGPLSTMFWTQPTAYRNVPIWAYYLGPSISATLTGLISQATLQPPYWMEYPFKVAYLLQILPTY